MNAAYRRHAVAAELLKAEGQQRARPAGRAQEIDEVPGSQSVPRTRPQDAIADRLTSGANEIETAIALFGEADKAPVEVCAVSAADHRIGGGRLFPDSIRRTVETGKRDRKSTRLNSSQT